MVLASRLSGLGPGLELVRPWPRTFCPRIHPWYTQYSTEQFLHTTIITALTNNYYNVLPDLIFLTGTCSSAYSVSAFLFAEASAVTRPELEDMRFWSHLDSVTPYIPA